MLYDARNTSIWTQIRLRLRTCSEPGPPRGVFQARGGNNRKDLAATVESSPWRIRVAESGPNTARLERPAVLLRQLRDDLHRAEQDHALSPAGANSLLDALGAELGSSSSWSKRESKLD